MKISLHRGMSGKRERQIRPAKYTGGESRKKEAKKRWVSVSWVCNTEVQYAYEDGRYSCDGSLTA